MGDTVDKKVKKVPCNVYSRVVGYISMVKRGNKAHWNKGKLQEFEERKNYKPQVQEE